MKRAFGGRQDPKPKNREILDRPMGAVLLYRALWAAPARQQTAVPPMHDEAPHALPRIVADGPDFSVTVRRNCSISPHGALLALAATAAVCFAIGAGFAFAGAWLILPFAGIEIAALAAAFYVYARHAGDYERISMRDGRLRIEIRDAEASAVHEFHPAWARVAMRRAASEPRLYVGSHGREVEIGRHLTAPARGALARELEARLQSGRDGFGI